MLEEPLLRDHLEMRATIIPDSRLKAELAREHAQTFNTRVARQPSSASIRTRQIVQAVKKPFSCKASLSTLRRRMGYYIPVLGWLPHYSFRENFGYDFPAGLTAAVILVPQGITFAGLAGVPGVYGLYAAFFPLIWYFIFGSGKHISVGPEVTSSILVGKVVAESLNDAGYDYHDEDYKEKAASLALALTMQVGIIALCMGLLRLGFVDSILSRPVLAGFVQAVAAILIINQLPILLGLPCQNDDCSPERKPYEFIMYVYENAKDINWPTVLMSTCCIVVMLGIPFLKRQFPSYRIVQAFPEVLVVVAAATWVTWNYDLDTKHDVHVLGEMKGGFKAPAWPSVPGEAKIRLFDALTITLLGFIETQIVNKLYAGKYGYTVSPNRELVALGISNSISCIFGSFCAFGSIPRSAIMEARGQKSNVATLVTVCFIFISILYVLPFFHYTPKAVTASIIFVVALGLIEVHEIEFIVRVKKWTDLGMSLLMTAVTLVYGIDMGIFFAFGSCLLMAVKQTTLPTLTVLGRGDQEEMGAEYRDLQDLDARATHIDGVLIYKVVGALFFANAQKLKESTQRMEKYGDLHCHPSETANPLHLSAIIFDTFDLNSVDATALATLLEIVESYTKRKRRVAFVSLRKPIKVLFQRAGIMRHVSRQHLFTSLPVAVAAMAPNKSVAIASPVSPVKGLAGKGPTLYPHLVCRATSAGVLLGSSKRDLNENKLQTQDTQTDLFSEDDEDQLMTDTVAKDSEEGIWRQGWARGVMRMMRATWEDDGAEDELYESAWGDLAPKPLPVWPPRPLSTHRNWSGNRPEHSDHSDEANSAVHQDKDEPDVLSPTPCSPSRATQHSRTL
eukprot:g37967.t1